MLAYVDTSAFVPLLVGEPSSPRCRRLWDDAECVVSTRLLYAETAAALAGAARAGRFDAAQHARALDELDFYWADVQVLDIDDSLVRTAAVYAQRFALRGYDSVHCAAAAALAGPDVVAASGDRDLLAAWGQLGIATFDPNVS